MTYYLHLDNDDLHKLKSMLISTDVSFSLLYYLSLLDLYSVRLVCKNACYAVSKYKRYKTYIDTSKKVICDEKWYKIIDKNLNMLFIQIKNDLPITCFCFQSYILYSIQRMKQELLIFNVLSHLLFCKIVCDYECDCLKCSTVYLKDSGIVSLCDYRLSSIYPSRGDFSTDI